MANLSLNRICLLQSSSIWWCRLFLFYFILTAVIVVVLHGTTNYAAAAQYIGYSNIYYEQSSAPSPASASVLGLDNLDRSIELFRSSIQTTIKNRDTIRLVCDFNKIKQNLNDQVLPALSSSFKSIQTNRSKSSSSSLPFSFLKSNGKFDTKNRNLKIKWFKLAANSTTVSFSKVFDELNESNKNEMIFVNSNEDMTSSDSSSSSNHFISELIFKPKYESDFNLMPGIYLCQSNFSFANQQHQTSPQFMQQISLNEMVDSLSSSSESTSIKDTSSASFKLTYSVIQTTNSRIIAEIISSQQKPSNPSNKNQPIEKLKLIYSLINSNNLTPILRGTIDFQNEFNSSNSNVQQQQQQQQDYLIFEGLSANTKYILLIYLKSTLTRSYSSQEESSNGNSFSLRSRVNLILNRTITTLSTTIATTSSSNNSNISSGSGSGFTDMTMRKAPSAFQIISRKFNEYGKDYYEMDEDYNEDDEEYDDSSVAGATFVDDYYSKDKIVDCDLSGIGTSKETPTPTNPPNQSSFTINYSYLNMNKLLLSLENNSSSSSFFLSSSRKQIYQISQNLSFFKDLFNLYEFRKSQLDYSINYECAKQLKANTNQKMFLKSSICLFNLISPWYSSSSSSSSYWLTMSNENSNNDYFSVQTSIYLPSPAATSASASFAANQLKQKINSKGFVVYVSSVCNQKKRSITNRNFPILPTKINSSSSSSATVAAMATTSTTTTTTEQSIPKEYLKNFVQPSNEKQQTPLVDNRRVVSSVSGTQPFNKNHYLNSNVSVLALNSYVPPTFNSIKSSQHQQSKHLNWLKSPNIENCSIVSEKEIQFVVEHQAANNYRINNLSNNNNNNKETTKETTLVYLIEIGTKLNAESLNQLIRQRMLKNHDYSIKSPMRFYVKKEKDHQMVRLNLSNVIYQANLNNKTKLFDLSQEDNKKYRNNQFQLNQKNLIKFNNLKTVEFFEDDTDDDAAATTVSSGDSFITSTVRALSLLNSNESQSSPSIESLLAHSKDNLFDSNIFKIKIRVFSEEANISSNLVEFDLECKTINNESKNLYSKNAPISNGYSTVSLMMTAFCTLIILVVAFLFCFIIKKKYGLIPEHFLNLKNNTILKSNNIIRLNSLDRFNLRKQKSHSSNNNNNGNGNTNHQHLHQQQQLYNLDLHPNNLKRKNYNSDMILSINTTSNSSSNLANYYSKNDEINIYSNETNNTFQYNFEEDDSIGVNMFEEYVQKLHVDGDFGFAQLYEEITNFTKLYSYNSDISLLECNRSKNRYSNILTYDHSRVKLNHDDKEESSGYINANYVDGYQKSNAYIATQGPMPNTFADFWRMIWEKNCSIIVMITNVKEKGRIKCDQYWPDDGIESYGNIQVNHLHTITLAFFTKRIFTIKQKYAKKRCIGERLIYQFHFTDWPDHGVPYYILPVLNFIKKSSRSNPDFGGPIVVHCSAGVGRTGTYIVIDAMMKQIKHKKTANIHTFLKHIRHQRNYLVQTEEQFIFIYDVILESIKSGETELTEHNYKSYINSLTRQINDDGQTLIDKQFDLITEFKPKDYQISFAQLTFNLDKNRNQKIIPVNNSRVILSKRTELEGSDYINATYLHGSCRQDEFIITQYPQEETILNFWQMVWDNNSNQLVVLNADDTESCRNYWLPIGESMKCESFSVILRDENFEMDFVIRDFLLQSIDEDYEFNCRMISVCYWPDCCTPIKSAFDLINKVRTYRNQSFLTTSLVAKSTCAANASPIVVHDLNGGFRAATFCALFTFYDLIQIENNVNVYELSKMYYLKRPGIWTNKSNIMFLYEAVEYLFEEINTNSQYQFKSYLNMSIDNHLNHNNHNNNSSATTIDNIGKNINQTTKTLSPVNTQTSVTTIQTVSNFYSNFNNGNNLKQQQQHHANYIQFHQQKNQLINNRYFLNDSIGSRLHSFQNQMQKNRKNSCNNNNVGDPLSTIPLTANIQIATHQPSTTTTTTTKTLNKIKNPAQPKIPIDMNTNSSKTSFIDIPRFLPSFFNIHNNTNTNINSNGNSNHHTNINNDSNGIINENINIKNSRRKSFIKRFEFPNKSTITKSETTTTIPTSMTTTTTTNSHKINSTSNRNSKAIRFMNTMVIKSTSFKRALFSQASQSSNAPIQQSSSQSNSESIDQQPQQEQQQSSQQQDKPQLE